MFCQPPQVLDGGGEVEFVAGAGGWRKRVGYSNHIGKYPIFAMRWIVGGIGVEGQAASAGNFGKSDDIEMMNRRRTLP